ncbi:DEAD/DEAH box helicase [Subtercola endophyticus]|uniref:DEAD/DEAH box helicase n=1 Tax=Subtercola endophyticus TaxID=2895559 RepID=UPI001E4D01F0|nr:DEAD/DEAH box helicase [Subtercola endophyticus]UFS57771.1 DEAD/DEAH box helicase [Subtercola endophyticus]
MSTPAFPLVDVGEISRLVGRAAFERGRVYARGREVLELNWNEQTLVLTGRVQGSAFEPYESEVILRRLGTRFIVEGAALCSCPMRSDCKHVAAVLLASNTRHLVEATPSIGVEPARQVHGSQRFDSRFQPADPARTPVRSTQPGDEFAESSLDRWNTDDSFDDTTREESGWFPPEPRLRPEAAAEALDWRSTLAALGPSNSANASGVGRASGARRTTGRTPGETTALGLQFEIREFVPRTREHWRGPLSQTAKPAASAEGGGDTGAVASGHPRRLAVRPVMKNHVGSFVKASLSWATLSHQTNRLNLDPAQAKWFAQFAALQRATRELYTGQEADWLYLDDFTSPLLWNLFDEANELGIALLGSKKSLRVRRGRHARVRLETHGGHDSALRLVPVTSLDGVDYERGATGLIGSHGVYVYELGTNPFITFTRLETPLDERVEPLFDRSSGIDVPADEVPEFFDRYFPRLQRAIDIVSADSAIPLPRISAPVLVLTARFRPKNVLQLDWEWEYGGDKRTRLPLSTDSVTNIGVSDIGVTDIDLSDIDRHDEVESQTLALVIPLIQRLIDDHSDAGIDGAINESVTEPARLVEHLVLQGFEAAVFTDKVLSELQHVAGVRVDIVGKRPAYRELSGVPELTVTTVESEKRDWFDLGIVVNMNGYRIPFAPLFKALARKQKKLLMVDKTYLALDHPVFERLRELLEEASGLDEWETGVRITRYQADLWSEFEDLAEESEQAVTWRDAVSVLSGSTAPDTLPVPAQLQATLRPYQHDGFEWLAFLFHHRLGGVLADDMGLGKTLQTLALIAHTRAAPTQPDLAHHGSAQPPADRVEGARPAAPFLVVAPTSVVSNWVNEAARFTPDLVVRSVTATQAKSASTLAELAEGADVLVTSYALFRLDAPAYRALSWSALVLDEAQFVKNHTSKLHRCAKDLDAPVKFAITGTPIENNLMELWALFDIVAPGLFPSSRKFTEDYVRPLGHGFDSEILTKLRRRIRPFLLRRTKELVAPELPAKQEQVLSIGLAPSHRSLYDTYFQRERQKLLGLIDDLDRNRLIVFRSLTLLRLLSLDASLIDEKYAAVPSAKLDALLEHLDDVAAEGHRALVFSQFTSFLKRAAERLDAQGIEYEYLDGSTRRRSEVIDRFKTGRAPVFLISLKAGGFGLNLTEADYVFLLDPWWNPASETQAIDRTHRIGQKQSVNVYRLVSADTIEEKVMALKEQKAQLFDAVLDDDATFSSALTADDIRGLFDT